MQRLSLLFLCAAAACGKAVDKKGATTATAAGPSTTLPEAPATTAPAGAAPGSAAESAADTPALTEAQLADAATYVTFSYTGTDSAFCRSFSYFPATAKASCSGDNFATAIDVPAATAAPLLDALRDVVIHDFASCADDHGAEYVPAFSINGASAIAVGAYDAKTGWSCENSPPHGIIAKTAPDENKIPFISLLKGAFKPALDAAAVEHPLLTADKLALDATVVTYSFESNGVPTCDWYSYKPKSGVAACGLFPAIDAAKTKTVIGADKAALDAALLDLSVRAIESCPDNGTREFFPHFAYGEAKIDVGTYQGGGWICSSGDDEHILIARTPPLTGTQPAFVTSLKAQLD